MGYLFFNIFFLSGTWCWRGGGSFIRIINAKSRKKSRGRGIIKTREFFIDVLYENIYFEPKRFKNYDLVSRLTHKCGY